MSLAHSRITTPPPRCVERLTSSSRPMLGEFVLSLLALSVLCISLHSPVPSLNLAPTMPFCSLPSSGSLSPTPLHPRPTQPKTTRCRAVIHALLLITPSNPLHILYFFLVFHTIAVSPSFTLNAQAYFAAYTLARGATLQHWLLCRLASKEPCVALRNGRGVTFTPLPLPICAGQPFQCF